MAIILIRPLMINLINTNFTTKLHKNYMINNVNNITSLVYPLYVSNIEKSNTKKNPFEMSSIKLYTSFTDKHCGKRNALKVSFRLKGVYEK